MKNKAQVVVKKIYHFIFDVFKLDIIEDSKLFNKSWYCEQYGIEDKMGALHYLLFGYHKGYNPSCYFSTNKYLLNNPDVEDHNPLLHYELHGKYEGRNTYLALDGGDFFVEDRSLNVRDFIGYCRYQGLKMYGDLENINSDKAVLLISHENSLTGAPIALESMALSLQSDGYSPIWLTPNDGKLSSRLSLENIATIIDPNLYTNGYLARFEKIFKFIVVNTIVPAPVIKTLSGLSTPVLWWIHESKVSYHPSMLMQIPENVGSNIHVYNVSNYSYDMLHVHRPNFEFNIMPYYIKDNRDIVPSSSFSFDKGNRKVFTMVATLEQRKGHHVLCEAIRSLPKEVVDGCLFVIVGKDGDKKIAEEIERLNADFHNVLTYYDGLNREEMIKLYQLSDCLVCASLDDPLPTVVTEAWQNNLSVICSKNTGTYAFIEQYGGGLLYGNNDPVQLADCMLKIYRQEVDVDKLHQEGMAIYQNFFTMPAFKRNLAGVIEKICRPYDFIGEKEVSIEGDNSLEMAKQEHVKLVEDGDYVLSVNGDVVIDDGNFISKLIYILEKTKSNAVVCGCFDELFSLAKLLETGNDSIVRDTFIDKKGLNNAYFKFCVEKLVLSRKDASVDLSRLDKVYYCKKIKIGCQNKLKPVGKVTKKKRNLLMSAYLFLVFLYKADNYADIFDFNSLVSFLNNVLNEAKRANFNQIISTDNNDGLVYLRDSLLVTKADGFEFVPNLFYDLGIINYLRILDNEKINFESLPFEQIKLFAYKTVEDCWR